MLIKIIIINAIIFLLLRIIAVGAALSGHLEIIDNILAFVQLPGTLAALLTRPWTILTYMFSHYDPTHILFNMLWLYWFGSIFMTLNQPWRLLPLYLYGGIAGAAVYLMAGAVTGAAGLIGASAAVIAIVTATAMMAPEFSVRLFLIGNIKLKWIAVITIGIDILSLWGSDLGGPIAHLGGALLGLIYALALRQGTDLAIPLKKLADRFSLSRRTNTPPRTAPSSSLENVDDILDKIKRSGYTSLTNHERQILFGASRRQNDDNKT